MGEYWYTRFLLLRLLGLVYFAAFISLTWQLGPLIGSDGITPASDYLDYRSQGSMLENVRELPNVFWLNSSDTMLTVCAWLGVLLSLLLVLGFANIPILFTNWFLYLSFTKVGQLWYGYGWEMQLLETGFLAIFMVPLIDPRPFRTAVPTPVIWLYRWLAFRIHLGSGLIKLRGDQCWTDLTCLRYHYETQPIPNPISRYLHVLPEWFHRLGVLWNHFVEVVVPWFAFATRWLRTGAGLLMISFQAILIYTGNLSFLNWLTIVPVIACFDDSFLRGYVPERWRTRVEERKAATRQSWTRIVVTWLLVLLVAYLSINPVMNLVSQDQAMNQGYTKLNLVNTYGAFGSVGSERPELVIQGTTDRTITSETEWETYDLKYNPNPVNESLPYIAPYQPRFDWQIWFAAMSTPRRNPWLLKIAYRLLQGDETVHELFEHVPIDEPEHVRIMRYDYNFKGPGTKPVWNRTRGQEWLQPVTESELRRALR